MNAAIATALRETADRAAVKTAFHDIYTDSDRSRMIAVAIQIAEATLRGANTENLVALYADSRASWIAGFEACVAHHDAAKMAIVEAGESESELSHANTFQADEAAWTNERALQEAQTEKEAHA